MGSDGVEVQLFDLPVDVFHLIACKYLNWESFSNLVLLNQKYNKSINDDGILWKKLLKVYHPLTNSSGSRSGFNAARRQEYRHLTKEQVNFFDAAKIGDVTVFEQNVLSMFKYEESSKKYKGSKTKEIVTCYDPSLIKDDYGFSPFFYVKSPSFLNKVLKLEKESRTLKPNEKLYFDPWKIVCNKESKIDKDFQFSRISLKNREKLFFAAASIANERMLDEMLSSKETYLYPLHLAVKTNNLMAVKLVLKKFPEININEENEKKLTPLQLNCERGNLTIARLLLQIGVDIKTSAPSPLKLALRHEYVYIVKLLLLNGVDPISALGSLRDGFDTGIRCIVPLAKNGKPINVECSSVFEVAYYIQQAIFAMSESNFIISETKLSPPNSPTAPRISLTNIKRSLSNLLKMPNSFDKAKQFIRLAYDKDKRFFCDYVDNILNGQIEINALLGSRNKKELSIEQHLIFRQYLADFANEKANKDLHLKQQQSYMKEENFVFK